MSNKSEKTREFLIWSIILLLVGVLFFIRPLFAYLIFNYAQISRMHGEIKPKLYNQALELVPNDTNLRCQTGDILAQSHDFDRAAIVLLPLIRNFSLSERCSNLVPTILSITHYEQEAQSFYLALKPKRTFSPMLAANILEKNLQSHTPIPPENLRILLTRTFYLRYVIYKNSQLDKQIVASDFWTTDLGIRTKKALAWKTKIVSNTSEVFPVPKPELSLIASLLNVSSEKIHFGNELATNGGFEDYDIIHDYFTGWETRVMTNRKTWDIAAFVIGADSTNAWNHNYSMRIDGLYIEDLPQTPKARVGYWHQQDITLSSNTPYILSFVYRTKDVTKNTTAVWLGNNKNVFWTSDKRFPATNGIWRRVTIIGWNRTDTEATIRPLLRSYGLGSVWFDDFSIRQIILPPGVEVEPQEPIVHIEDAEK